MKLLMMGLLTVSFAAQGNRGGMSVYEGVVNSIYLGKQVYWTTAEGTPLTAIITKVIIPEINDKIGSHRGRRIEFEVRAELEMPSAIPENQPVPVHSHEPSLQSVSNPSFPAEREDEDGGQWVLVNNFYQLTEGRGYTISSARVIRAGFMIDKRVHFSMEEQGEEVDYAGEVTGLVPSISGRWSLSINKLSAGFVPDGLPTVFEPNEVKIASVEAVKGQMQLPPTRPQERITPYIVRSMNMNIWGLVVATYSSDYWEFLNYTRSGTEDVVEPYLFLVHNNDIMFHNSPY